MVKTLKKYDGISEVIALIDDGKEFSVTREVVNTSGMVQCKSQSFPSRHLAEGEYKARVAVAMAKDSKQVKDTGVMDFYRRVR